jgi:hypothetical protein
MGGFTAGDNGDRADQRYQQQHSSRLHRHKMAAEQFATEPGHVIVGQRIDCGLGSPAFGGRGFGRPVFRDRGSGL